MRHAVAVLSLALSACTVHKPVQSAPALPPDIMFQREVLRFVAKTKIQGHVFATTVRHEQVDGMLARSWRVDPGVYIVVANRKWLREATPYSILEGAVHEVCHIALGHVDDLADRRIVDENFNDGDSFWHRQTYRCIVDLIGEDLFCKSMTDEEPFVDTATCRAYLRLISR